MTSQQVKLGGVYHRPKLHCFTPQRPRRCSTSQHRLSIRADAWARITEFEVGQNHVAAPIDKRPKGIVHFLGGAFAGAAPQFAYQFLIKWLADAGYTVISTPYAVTFRHLDCAQTVHREFTDSLSMLKRGSQNWAVPRGIPIHGMGHSNGALMHLLIGSQLRPQNASNVIISYNNKEVKEAIPVPLDNLQDVIRSARQSPWRGALPTTEAILEGAVALSAATQGILDRRTALALKPALDQIGSVLEEVGDGLTEFYPPPSESRELIARNYSVPDTLLLRFADDGIDESPLALAALRRRERIAGVQMVTLPGSHVTPCGGDVNWQVGPLFTPLDALALSATALFQVDIKRTAQRVTSWLDLHS